MMGDELTILRLKITRLEAQAEQLTLDNRALRKRLGDESRHTRRIGKAYEDGVLLASWSNAAIAPTLALALAHGMNRRPWQNAIGLLRLAGVVHHAPRYAWMTTNTAEVERRLALARDLAISNPGMFRGCLGRHANHETL